MSVSSLSPRSSFESLCSRSPTPSFHSEVDQFPPMQEGPMVWEGAQMNPQRYVVELSAAEIENIRAAIIRFKLLGLPRSAIDRETFALGPDLVSRLSGMSDQVHSGGGVAVLRGLNAARFNDEEAVIAFAGISAHVCPKRATDSYANQTLSHVRDATHDTVPEWAKDIGLAGSKLTTAMEFHCDRFSGDVLALYVRNDGAAQGGGEQFVTSFWRIYNELLATDPEVVDTLAAADWPFELKHRTDKLTYVDLGPAIFFAQGKPICQIVRAPLIGGARIPRSDSVPKISAKQMHALEAVENLARRFCVKLDRQNGDIQFINNLAVMHARSAYGVKAAGQKSTRHLLRMFLRDPKNAWEKPRSFKAKFDDPFEENREQNIPILDLDPWRKISGRESHG